MSDPVEAVSAAVQAACQQDGDVLRVDVDAFERALKKAGVPILRADKGKLKGELELLRDEIRRQKARAANSDEPDRLNDRVATLCRREQELEQALWPNES